MPIFCIFGAKINIVNVKQDYIILNAKLGAFTTYFKSLLPIIFQNDPDTDGKVWLAKYLLWQSERELLAPYDSEASSGSPDSDTIGRRRFQLQVLMDVAYIQGRLEEYGIARIVDSYAAAHAQHVFHDSDGSEETMLPLIDALDDYQFFP